MRVSDTIKSNAAAIIGMCKNAGKTTVLNSLVTDMAEVCMGLTSIGRDGETVDVATVTPKPDIYVRRGTVFATAAELLKYCDTTVRILDTCGIYTPLGEVILAKAESDGNIQIAGPSTVEGLIKVHGMMQGAGAQMCIFDGAISRKSLAVPTLCDEAVLCSGASYSPSMKNTVEDTAFYAKLFTLNVMQDDFGADSKFAVRTDDGKIMLKTPDDLKAALKKYKSISCLRIRGAVTDPLLTAISELGARGTVILADDPSKLIIGRKAVEKCEIRDMRIAVTKRAKLCAVTVNPFSAYGTGYDKAHFYDAMKMSLERYDVPVFDVKQEKQEI